MITYSHGSDQETENRGYIQKHVEHLKSHYSCPTTPILEILWKDGMASQTVPPTNDQVFKQVRRLGQFGLKPLTRACSTLFSITAHIL